MVREVFQDPFTIEWADLEQDPNEERYGVIGMVEGRLLFVAYMMRGEKIRIITARKAEPYERRRYHEENREA
jgi:uncharacterized protein